MTREGYIEARDLYHVQSNDVNRDRYFRAFLEWAGTVLDRLNVKYTTAEEVKNGQAGYDMVRAL